MSWKKGVRKQDKLETLNCTQVGTSSLIFIRHSECLTVRGSASHAQLWWCCFLAVKME